MDVSNLLDDTGVGDFALDTFVEVTPEEDTVVEAAAGVASTTASTDELTSLLISAAVKSHNLTVPSAEAEAQRATEELYDEYAKVFEGAKATEETARLCSP